MKQQNKQIRLPSRQPSDAPPMGYPTPSRKAQPTESAGADLAQRSPEIERVAITLRNAYRQRHQLCRSVWSTGEPEKLLLWDRELPPGDREFWRLLAEEVIQRNIDPLTFVGVIFSQYPSDKLPRPADLTIALFDKSISGCDLHLRIQLKSNLERFEVQSGIVATSQFSIGLSDQARTRRSWEAGVRSHLMMNPLFCHLAALGMAADKRFRDDEAAQRSFRGIADQYFFDAVLVYFSHPTGYDRIWSGLMGDFRHLAMREYRRLYDVPDNFVFWTPKDVI
jgi:hypothetical protein